MNPQQSKCRLSREIWVSVPLSLKTDAGVCWEKLTQTNPHLNCPTAVPSQSIRKTGTSFIPILCNRVALLAIGIAGGCSTCSGTSPEHVGVRLSGRHPACLEAGHQGQQSHRLPRSVALGLRKRDQNPGGRRTRMPCGTSLARPGPGCFAGFSIGVESPNLEPSYSMAYVVSQTSPSHSSA